MENLEKLGLSKISNEERYELNGGRRLGPVWLAPILWLIDEREDIQEGYNSYECQYCC